MKFVSVLILLAVVTACDHKPIDRSLYPETVRGLGTGNGRCLDVPFVKQSWMTCGAAAVCECLGYYGFTVKHDAIADEMDAWTGTTDDRVVKALEAHGCTVLYLEPCGIMYQDIMDLHRYIDLGNPIIIGVRHSSGTPGLYRNHYMVVVGWTVGQIIVHNGSSPYAPLSDSELHELWMAHKTTIVVRR